MNNRDYKEFAVGGIFHIYNRGNNKERIFFDDQDYKAFLFRLGLVLGFEQKELLAYPLLSLPYSRIRIADTKKGLFRLHAFCLMPNHFHLMIEQCGNMSISKFITKVCGSYSKYVNNKYERVGHIFQDCFKSVTMESNEQLMWASAYIHMNAVKDGLVKHPNQYVWSSYNDFVNERNLPIVYPDFLKSIFGNKKDFEKETKNIYSTKIKNVKETL